MQVRGPLMIEHRLIERMVALIGKEVERIRKTGNVDILFIDTAVDFIRIYTDRTHHGKEEDLLFKVLAEKEMTDEEKKVMDELIEEHVQGRKTVHALVDARDRYVAGDTAAIDTIIEKFDFLVDFYPKHIEKEDKVFFPAVMKYLPTAEQDQMLQEFNAFDQKMIHDKYRDIVEKIEE